MTELAVVHGETGWRAHAFPLSADGIEIVASLVLLADRRAGRQSGWLPWAALSAGTVASLAANVAVGGTDVVGRVVAGWPAVALLVAIKLLSGLLSGQASGDRSVPDDSDGPGPSATCPDRAPVRPGQADTPASGQRHDPGTGPFVPLSAVSRPADVVDPHVSRTARTAAGDGVKRGSVACHDHGTGFRPGLP
ncbi:MAG: DUF2637 domain-containing protein [Micromonosporaceae bacterium]